ncbi:MAG: winged helix-turn-helix domain-containing protein [Phycisphaerae bacterium]|nr:winged helix-turn-helix domain-containing protein [Phycisphaerae bacterium]
MAARAAASVFGPEVLGPAADGAQPTPTSGTPTARGGKKTKEPRAATAPKPSKAPKVKTLSALDAAAQVLAKSTKPMSATEMIERMATQGLWESPGGKTPSATLYAAIIREISAKAGEARFRKVDRGMFEYAG